VPLLFAGVTFNEFFTRNGFPDWAALLLSAGIHAAFIFGLFIGLAPLVYIWLERKVAGRIQDRLGPTRVGGKFGWLQTLADGIKLIQKEDLAPASADRFLFPAAPYVVFVATACAFLALPWSSGWIAQNLQIGIFFILAVLSLEVIGVILAGYSSGSKWALFGGMREAAQVVSYEIPMAICALVPVISLGTLNLMEIAQTQAGWFFNWMLFNDPFTFIAFFAYFTVATASVKRAPFDLAEAESELVAGFHTEYSGIRWSYFFMAEYATMYIVSAIATLLFLGGWSTGLAPIDGAINSLRSFSPAFISESGFLVDGFNIGNYLANLIFMLILVTKSSLLVFVQMWVRWTLPRLRIDQVMTTCLKYLLPISCVLLIGVSAWPLALHAATGRTTLIPGAEPLGSRVVESAQVATGKSSAKVSTPSESVSIAATEGVSK
jgi:NADH-quinone oxidoreductase subunit H